MASSRLEKIGNIFTRVKGLLKSGAMKYEDRPLFYEIYQSFPPLRERKYNEQQKAIIRPIFYSEDLERASRDDTNSLFTLNETSGKRKDPTFNKPPAPQETIESKDHKMFDFSQLSNLKE